MVLSAVQAAKLHVVAATGLTKDALHIYVGMAVWLIASLVLRKSLKSVAPLAAVLAVAALGEALDAWDDIAGLGHWRVHASVHDVANTMFWPTLLWLLIRYTKVMK